MRFAWALHRDSASGLAIAEPRIDRDVASENYLYVEEGGVVAGVRIDLDNTQVEGPSDVTGCARGRVRRLQPLCAHGSRTEEGGAAGAVARRCGRGLRVVEELSPDLKRTRGLYRLEQYAGRFERIEPAVR